MNRSPETFAPVIVLPVLAPAMPPAEQAPNPSVIILPAQPTNGHKASETSPVDRIVLPTENTKNTMVVDRETITPISKIVLPAKKREAMASVTSVPSAAVKSVVITPQPRPAVPAQPVARKGGNKRSGRKDARKSEQAAARADMGLPPLVKQPVVATVKTHTVKPKPVKIVQPAVNLDRQPAASKSRESLINKAKASRLGQMALTAVSARPTGPKLREQTYSSASKGYEQVKRHKVLAAAVGLTAMAGGLYFAARHGFNPFGDAVESANNTDVASQTESARTIAPTEAPVTPPVIEAPPVAITPPNTELAAPINDMIMVEKGDGMTDLIKEWAANKNIDLSGQQSYDMYQQAYDQLAGAEGTYKTDSGEIRLSNAGGQFRIPAGALAMFEEMLETEKKRRGIA